MTQRIKEELHRKYNTEETYKGEHEINPDSITWEYGDLYDEPYEEEDEDDIESLDRESYRAYKDAERDISRHKHW